MFDSLAYEEYAANLNSGFKVIENGAEITLSEITERKLTSNQDRFSLIFSGPGDMPLEQKIYRLSHEKLGEGEIFLVPVSQDSEGYKYEAGFNRLLDT